VHLSATARAEVLAVMAQRITRAWRFIDVSLNVKMTGPPT
jgi:hypothetical protein